MPEQPLPVLCHMCGKPATGLASLSTPTLGHIRLCHGDDDLEPTCYERFARVAMDSMANNPIPFDILNAVPDAKVIRFPVERTK